MSGQTHASPLHPLLLDIPSIKKIAHINYIPYRMKNQTLLKNPIYHSIYLIHWMVIHLMFLLMDWWPSPEICEDNQRFAHGRIFRETPYQVCNFSPISIPIKSHQIVGHNHTPRPFIVS
jgi:hypothetical protein